MSQMDLKLLSDVLHALVSSFSKTLQFPLLSTTYSSDDSLITIPKINFSKPKKNYNNLKKTSEVMNLKLKWKQNLISYLLGDQ